jgi:hypothetical protein
MALKNIPYNKVSNNRIGLVNWRPLTVRLAGYLGGANSALDGVFDMQKGTQLALHLGARCFIFDIDYLDAAPCIPVVVYRDRSGIMRSLHTGDIRVGMQTLSDMAFKTNYDPVVIVIYLRRIPPGTNQQSLFFKAIASYLDTGNIAKYHLGSTEQGNYYNCLGENHLFTDDITNFQKKFIVISNYDTSILPPTGNPKDNLHFWTNARIYKNPSSTDLSVIGSVTQAVENGMAFAYAGSTHDYLNIPAADQQKFIKISSMTFNIAIGPVDEILTATQLAFLLNSLGVQCVPIDVLNLALNSSHAITMKNIKAAPTLEDLSSATNDKDLLSFWAYAGWSIKPIVEGFENPEQPPSSIPATTKIVGFVRPEPVIPKKPHPSMNSNGGLVSIT